MAPHLVVLDSSARRAVVKILPGTYMRDVLESACSKFNLSADNYTLKFNNKAVDLSVTQRLSNIPQGACLDLVQSSRSARVVSVALQLPASENNVRLTNKFASTTSIWQILRVFETQQQPGKPSFNFTQRTTAARPTSSPSPSPGSRASRFIASASKNRLSKSHHPPVRLNYEMPVVLVLDRKLGSLVELQKTLAQLGLSGGTVLLRLSFQDSGQPIEEAMTEISKYFQTAEESRESAPPPSSSSAAADPNSSSKFDGQPTDPPDNVDLNQDSQQADSHDSQMESSEIPSQSVQSIEEALKEGPSPTEEASPLVEPMENAPAANISIYAPPKSKTASSTQEVKHDESDFALSLDLARVYQESLKKQGQNQRLPSDAELAASLKEKEKGMAGISSVIVRVRFPDQNLAERQFASNQTAEDVYSFTNDLLSYPNEPFVLKYTGDGGLHMDLPKTKERTLVRDLGFCSRILLSFFWETGASIEATSSPALKSEWRGKAQELSYNTSLFGDAGPNDSVSSGSHGTEVNVKNNKESKLMSLFKKKMFKK